MKKNRRAKRRKKKLRLFLRGAQVRHCIAIQLTTTTTTTTTSRRQCRQRQGRLAVHRLLEAVMQ